MEKEKENREMETKETEKEKKTYQAPALTRHEPLESVSATVYYYYLF